MLVAAAKGGKILSVLNCDTFAWAQWKGSIYRIRRDLHCLDSVQQRAHQNTLLQQLPCQELRNLNAIWNNAAPYFEHRMNRYKYSKHRELEHAFWAQPQAKESLVGQLLHLKKYQKMFWLIQIPLSHNSSYCPPPPLLMKINVFNW